MADVIIHLYDITGCDHKCDFYGLEKKQKKPTKQNKNKQTNKQKTKAKTVIKKLWKALKQEFCKFKSSDTFLIPVHLLKNLKTFMIKYVYVSKELGCAGNTIGQNEKEEHGKTNAKWKYFEPYLSTCKPPCILPKKLPGQPSSLSKWKRLGESLMKNVDQWETFYLHDKLVYHPRLHGVMKTAVIRMILIIALKQTQQN